ncbi:MAG: hypothetical protein ACE5K3_09795 [bacterium]
METGISHEKKTPSLECFSCHGPHPPRSAEEIDLANFAISPHARGPELTCSHCHEYPEEVEELDPNGCTGCHRRGGYPIKTALEALIKAGHPDVIPMIKTVPENCLSCHQKNLGPLLHRRHLLESPKFVLHFQTGCLRCHSLKESGETVIKSQPRLD